MTKIYISPILGEISEYTYNKFIALKHQDYNTFINSMRSELKYGILRSGVLVIETEFKDIKVSGAELYNYLTNFGFSDNTSINIVKLFSTNNRLIENLIEQGFNLNDVVYGMDLKARLDALGLESSTVTKSYALENIFIVHQLLEVEIEEPPPPPEMCYRTQLAYLYTAKRKKSEQTPEIVAEFRVWGESNQKGTYKIKYFERTILQMERIMKGEGLKPKNWLNSIDKTIKASEEDEPMDCDEIKEMNYAQRGVAFRDEWGSEISVEYDEKWLRYKEKQLIEEGKLKCKFDNNKGILVYPDGASCIREEEK